MVKIMLIRNSWFSRPSYTHQARPGLGSKKKWCEACIFNQACHCLPCIRNSSPPSPTTAPSCDTQLKKVNMQRRSAQSFSFHPSNLQTGLINVLERNTWAFCRFLTHQLVNSALPRWGLYYIGAKVQEQLQPITWEWMKEQSNNLFWNIWTLSLCYRETGQTCLCPINPVFLWC